MPQDVMENAIQIINSYLANVPILKPMKTPENHPENIRKLLLFWCFQGDIKWELDQKWVIKFLIVIVTTIIIFDKA